MLMNKVPDLQAYTKGRDVLLVFEKDVAPAIALACSYVTQCIWQKLSN